MYQKSILLLALFAAPLRLVGQEKKPDPTGIWKVDAGTDVKNGPREVIIRSDSSASWGKEIARWRIVKDKIWIAVGGEWEVYDLKLKETSLTLSGGGLQKAIALKKAGPATPLPAGVKVPKDPGN